MDETLDSEDVAMLNEAFSENYLRPWAGGVPRLFNPKDAKRVLSLVDRGFLEYSQETWFDTKMEGYDLTEKGFSFVFNLRRGEIEKWADKQQQAGTGGQVNG